MIKKINIDNLGSFVVIAKKELDIYKDLEEIIELFFKDGYGLKTFLCSFFSKEKNKFSFFFIQNTNEHSKTFDVVRLDFKINLTLEKLYSDIKTYNILLKFDSFYESKLNDIFNDFKLDDIIKNECNVEYYIWVILVKDLQ